MKLSKPIFAAMATLSVVTAACAEGSGQTSAGAAADEKWACAPEQIATSEYELDTGGGYETTDAALKAVTRVLASDDVADQAALTDAAAAADDSGRLVIDGEIVADVEFSKLEDGTWTVSSVKYCSPPPGEAGSPAPTPSDAVEEANS
jgi:hypothetical protein